MRSAVVAAAVAVLAALALTTRAGACSCAYQEPRERLKTADAAVIGTIVDDGDPARLRVEERFKGDVADEIELPNPKDTGSSCEPGYERGQKVAIFLERRDDGRWAGGLCDHADPDELRRAARPLPEPAGRGTAALIAVGEFAGHSAVVLDAKGRLLAYGRGEGWRDASICPGSRHMVGVTGKGRRQRFVIRRLRDLAVVRRRRAPAMDVAAVSCRSADGRRLAAILHVYDEPLTRAGRLVLLGDRGRRTLRRARIAGGTFVGDTAYLDEGMWGRDLASVDLRTGATRRIARVPNIPGVWSRSPDGRHLATTAFGPDLTYFDLSVVVDLRTGRVRTRRTGGTVIWTGRDRLLNDSPASLALYDARLRRVRARGHGVSPEGNLVRTRGRVFGLHQGDLYAVDPVRPGARRIATLPSRELRYLIAIPGGTELDARGGGAE